MFLLMKIQNDLFSFCKKHKNVLAFSVIGIFALLLLRSAFYSIASPDESFYLTIPYRLILGDSLVVDEWHASQFSAFLMYLPMKLYMLITKGTDGIVLFMRCLFVFCQTTVSCYTYIKLKKYGVLPALVSSVLYLLYVPETVNMLDYYTMSLMGCQVAVLTLFFTENLKVKHLLFTGIVFACVVITQPFNCLIYFVYSAAVFVCIIAKNKVKKSDFAERYLSHKVWFYITIGIVLVALVFLVFLFSKMTFTEFVNNFGNIFGGHDHTLPFAETGETDMFSYMTIVNTLYYYIPVSFIMSVILIVLLLLDKTRIKNRKFWLGIACITVIALTIEMGIAVAKDMTSVLFKPYILFVLTFVCLMLTKNKDKKLFSIWFAGIAYVVCLGIISQALDYVGVIGLVISNCALLPAFKQMYMEISAESCLNKDSKQTNIYNKYVVKAIFCVVILVISFDAVTGTGLKLMDDPSAVGFGRSGISADIAIDKGPLKGIRTDKDTLESYNNILSDLEEIKENSCEKVLVAGLVPWIYFCFDESPATFTTWYIKEEFNLYQDYYNQDTDRLPVCIYVPRTRFYWSVKQENFAIEYKEFFSSIFTVEEKNGKEGYIMYVKGLK